MKIYTVIFAFKNGKNQLKVITFDGRVPYVDSEQLTNKNVRHYIKTMLIQNLGLDYDWSFQAKNFSDKRGEVELFYIFYLPEQTKLDRYEWTDIDKLSDHDKELLEEVRKNV